MPDQDPGSGTPQPPSSGVTETPNQEESFEPYSKYNARKAAAAAAAPPPSAVLPETQSRNKKVIQRGKRAGKPVQGKFAPAKKGHPYVTPEKRKYALAGRPNARLEERFRKIQQYMSEHPEATLAEAGRFAGFRAEPGSQAANVVKTMTARNLQKEMAEMMEEDRELSNQALMFKLKEGLKSERYTYSFDKSGNHVETLNDPDMIARKAYLSLIGKWKGLEMTKQEISGPGGGPIPEAALNVLAGLSKEDLAKFLDVMNSKDKKK